MTTGGMDSGVVGRKQESYSCKWRNLQWLYQYPIRFPHPRHTQTHTHRGSWAVADGERKQINRSVSRMDWFALGLLSSLCICLLVCKDHTTKGLITDLEKLYH